MVVVNPSNSKDILESEFVDGVLVGGASTKIDQLENPQFYLTLICESGFRIKLYLQCDVEKNTINFIINYDITLNAQTSIDNSIHQFKVADIYGNIFDFSQLKGKKL